MARKCWLWKPSGRITRDPESAFGLALPSGAVSGWRQSDRNRKSHLPRASMSNSGLSNRRVRSLPIKMTLSAQPRFLTIQFPEERFKPLDQV